MKKLGKELVFISQINRNGNGTVNVEEKDMGYLDNEEFHVNCLSLTEETYIASQFNSFVVKLRKVPANTFRKKTFIIEAIRYTGNNGAELNKWSGGRVIESPVVEPTNYNPTGAYVQIHPPAKGVESKMFMPTTAIVGDWICKGGDDNFYSCKNHIFEAQYEKIEEE